MEANQKMLDAVKWVSGTGCVIGFIIFALSLFVSDYNKDYILTAVGMAITLSAAAIFLVGIFFVLTEEMVMNTHKGKIVVPETTKIIKINSKVKTKRSTEFSN
jgi:TRAP-type C4-dicarboxylate transport system permease small subunit